MSGRNIEAGICRHGIAKERFRAIEVLGFMRLDKCVEIDHAEIVEHDGMIGRESQSETMHFFGSLEVPGNIGLMAHLIEIEAQHGNLHGLNKDRKMNTAARPFLQASIP